MNPRPDTSSPPDIVKLEDSIQTWINATGGRNIHLGITSIWPLVPLLPPEEVYAQNMVDKRRAEFAAGRLCARLALSHLGLEDSPILRGDRGEPVWPGNIVGSISHDLNLAIAVVSPDTANRAIGIDMLDLEHKIDPSAVNIVANDTEVGGVAQMLSGTRHAAAGEIPLDPLLLAFSAKESAIKSLSPAIDYYLDFRDLALDCEQETIRLHCKNLNQFLLVHWCCIGNKLFTFSCTATA